MPRTGRPIKGEEKKDQSLQLRLGKKTIEKLIFCAESQKTSKTDIIEKGIDLVFSEIKK